MKQSNQSGPGLAVTLAVIGGGGAGLFLASHPTAWPHATLATLIAHTGHASSPLLRAGIGAGIAAVAAMLPGVWLEEQLKSSQRRAAIRRTDREAAEDAAVRDQIRGVNATTKAGGLANAIAEADEPKSNRATPMFVAKLVAAAGVVIAIQLYFF